VTTLPGLEGDAVAAQPAGTSCRGPQLLYRPLANQPVHAMLAVATARHEGKRDSASLSVSGTAARIDALLYMLHADDAERMAVERVLGEVEPLWARTSAS
jgi:hypothetical protein